MIDVLQSKSSDDQKVDYDLLAGQYDRRYQFSPLSGVEQTLIQLGKQLNAKRILEVGCGTGHWLAGLMSHFPETQVFGLDASFGMLEQVNQSANSLCLMQGKAGQLPITEEQFDLIFCVNALHHFDDRVRFIQQAGQCLRPHGRLAIIGQIPQDRRNNWYVYDYFEGTLERDLQRFPSWGTVTDWMLAAGFHPITLAPVEWISDDKIGWDVLDDPFIQKKATSQLALLSNEAYQAGVEQIKKDLIQAERRNQRMVFRAQLRLDMITGIKLKEI